MSITELEIRISTLEQKIVSLAAKIDSSPCQDVNAWIDQIRGTFRNDATYREAAKLGHEWRRAGRASAAALGGHAGKVLIKTSQIL